MRERIFLLTTLILISLFNTANAIEIYKPGYIVETYAIYPQSRETRDLVFDNAGYLYATHDQAGSIWRIASDGTTKEFVNGLTYPIGIIWAGGTTFGSYFYIIESETFGGNLIKVAQNGSKSNFTTLSAHAPSPLGIDKTGNYGNALYIGSTGNDHIYRIDDDGQESIFSYFPYSTNNGGPQAIVFDTTGNYGGVMYVGTAFSGTENADMSGLFYMDTNGNETKFTHDLAKIKCIAIDEQGAFGGYMFALGTSKLDNPYTLWQIAPNGHAIEFASDCSDIVFGPDGAMYASELSAAGDTIIISRISINSNYVDTDSDWLIKDSNIYYNDGNVGIGTNSPDAKLDINGQIKIRGGSPGVDKVLTSDASGLACWQTLSTYGDITKVSAGTGLSGGGTSGDVTLNIDLPLSLKGSFGNPPAAIIMGNHTEDGIGVKGESSSGTGVSGESSSGTGVYGYSATGKAGYFSGDVHVSGNLSKSSGSFKIDHPLDPENKFLQHSFVESPDMMNIYNGNVTLDENGQAVVQLPDYFEALNYEFRYQLTPIGAPGPNLYIAKKISENCFNIAGGNSGMEVSWQVTGIRQDPYAVANRIEVEVDKLDHERGSYLQPKAYSLSEEHNIENTNNPQIIEQQKGKESIVSHNVN